MKKEDIFKAIGDIDEVYLNESEHSHGVKIKPWGGIGKTLTVAAALILMFGAALVLPKMMPGNGVTPLDTGGNTDTSDTANADTEIISKINQNLDIIMEDSDSFISEHEFVIAHPDEFEDITALGEDALPYLQELAGGIEINDDSTANRRRIIAAYLSYLIKPELYEKVYTSPDGKYAIKAVVATFFSMDDSFGDIEYTLVDGKNGWIITTALYSNGNGSVIPAFSWSPDSKYAVFEERYLHEYTNIILFDTTSGSYHTLYDEEVLETFAKREFTYTDPTGTVWDRVHCNFAEWGTDSVKVTLSLASPDGGRLTFGSYVYEIPTKYAQMLEYDLDLDEQWEQNFGPSEDGGIEIIEVDGVKIPIPSKYAADIIEGKFSSSSKDNILATLIYMPERDVNGNGEICAILRLTHEEYEYAYALYGDNSGADNVLAKDENYYYVMRVPVDLQGGGVPNATIFTPIRSECVKLIDAEFGKVNGIGIIIEPIEPQGAIIDIVEVDGIKIPIYNKHESYSDIAYDTDGDYLFILYNKPQYESAGGGNQYLFKLYKYTKHEYLYNFASDEEFGVPPAVNDFRSRASVVAIDGDYYYVMLIGDVPPTKTLYSEAVCEHFAEINGFEKLNDGNNVLEEIFTYESEHKYYRYYPDGIETDYFYMIVLSQPTKQGEGGIWCVDRYFSMQTSGTPLVDTAGRPTIGWQIHLPMLPVDGENTDFDAYYKVQQQEYDSGNPDYEFLGNPASLINRWCEATFGESYSATKIVQVDYLANGIYDY